MLIGYSRKSTLDQSHNLQIDALTQAGCQTIYQETMSGAKRHRPELEAALKSLRPNDTLVVWKLDRMGRSLKNLVDIINDLEERNIGFKSLTESIDTRSNTGKLVFNIFASLAEFERNLIRERTSAGLAAARARGRQGGRPSMNTGQAHLTINSIISICPISLVHPSPAISFRILLKVGEILPR